MINDVLIITSLGVEDAGKIKGTGIFVDGYVTVVVCVI